MKTRQKFGALTQHSACASFGPQRSSRGKLLAKPGDGGGRLGGGGQAPKRNALGEGKLMTGVAWPGDGQSDGEVAGKRRWRTSLRQKEIRPCSEGGVGAWARALHGELTETKKGTRGGRMEEIGGGEARGRSWRRWLSATAVVVQSQIPLWGGSLSSGARGDGEARQRWRRSGEMPAGAARPKEGKRRSSVFASVGLTRRQGAMWERQWGAPRLFIADERKEEPLEGQRRHGVSRSGMGALAP